MHIGRKTAESTSTGCAGLTIRRVLTSWESCAAPGRDRMSLVKSGRARLALALPRHREQLRSLKDHRLDDLLEAYALAAKALDGL